ncbi:hypothetical protein UFOVP194_20 [uncultured Caudovirales phage]|uniref:Uncharacterized protein n=1 Tax=uncultured Caudovirales phage TaxID=2100421 RepID=A0A6J7WI52_9CAUD|nr:hypothetical protein UFOVP194_20 [uncultured Caudovirales phage]
MTIGFRWAFFYIDKDGYFYFRILGYGLHIKPSKNHVKLFSERYGYKKAYYFAGLRFEFLKPKGE